MYNANMTVSNILGPGILHKETEPLYREFELESHAMWSQLMVEYIQKKIVPERTAQWAIEKYGVYNLHSGVTTNMAEGFNTVLKRFLKWKEIPLDTLVHCLQDQESKWDPESHVWSWTIPSDARVPSLPSSWRWVCWCPCNISRRHSKNLLLQEGQIAIKVSKSIVWLRMHIIYKDKHIVSSIVNIQVMQKLKINTELETAPETEPQQEQKQKTKQPHTHTVCL